MNSLQTSSGVKDLCNDIGRSDTLPSLDCVELWTTEPVVDTCDYLKDGKEYYIQTPDGRYVVHNAAKSFAFMESVNVKHASKFTATKVGCNTYGLCVNGHCMSRCMACSSYTWDIQTVKFHLTDSKEPYSRWTFNSTGNDGEYNLETDRSFGYLTYKNTSHGYQLTLTPELSNETSFRFVEVPVESSSIEIPEEIILSIGDGEEKSVVVEVVVPADFY